MYLKGKYFDVNLINFIEQFPDETSCKLKFKAMRDKVGVTCRHCGSQDHYWQQSIWMYECKKCKTRTTLRSGTVMQASKLPFRYWFIAIHLLTSTKKPFSSLELQRQLGHKYYEPIWYMMQKLRKTMISNAKRNLLGIHHMISKKYFQDYLDEFCYKVNRRYFGEKLFDRLLLACASYNYKDYIQKVLEGEIKLYISQ